jgi:hypothetical protein
MLAKTANSGAKIRNPKSETRMNAEAQNPKDTVRFGFLSGFDIRVSGLIRGWRLQQVAKEDGPVGDSQLAWL